MKLPRRDFLIAFATAGAVSSFPAVVTAIEPVLPASMTRRVVLLTGLPTDAAFAAGIGDATRWSMTMDAAGFSRLLSALRGQRARQLYGLLEERSAVLAEEALRECGAALLHRTAVCHSAYQDAAQWAWQLGQQLVSDDLNTIRAANAGRGLIALHARL